jgi:hypothetical protein
MLHDPAGSPDPQVPELLVVGNACIDRQLSAESVVERLGGASAFAARVAALGGVQVGMVAAGPADFTRLHDLGASQKIWLAAQDCRQSTLFEVYGSGPNQTRRERVIGAADPLLPQAIPAAWRAAPVTYVAPVLEECGSALVQSLQSPVVVVGAQGWLRRVDEAGWVQFAETEEFLRPPANVTAMVFSEADHPDACAAAASLAQRGILAVVTQSSAGGVVYAPHKKPLTYRATRAIERDTTGAGDCFGVVFALALSHQIPLSMAATLAARAAAKVVEGPELGTLLPQDVEQALGRRKWSRPVGQTGPIEPTAAATACAWR